MFRTTPVRALRWPRATKSCKIPGEVPYSAPVVQRPRCSGPPDSPLDPQVPLLLPVYLGSLALGGVLIVASIVLGDADHDADLDLDADVDVDADVDLDADVDADADLDGDVDKDFDLAQHAADAGGTWLPFLSLRFWTFGLATFGGAGAILDVIGFSDLVSAPASAVTGIGVGWAIAAMFRRLKHERVTADVGLRQLSGQEGKLLLPVAPGKVGKVRVTVGGQDVDLMARSSDGVRLEPRQRVLVVGVDDGVAEVTSLPDGSTADP